MKSHLICALLLMMLCVVPAAAQDVVVVRDGQAQAHIVIGVQAPENVQKAAQVLAEYLRTATGADVPLVTDDTFAAGEETVIEIGPTALGGGDGLIPEDMDMDGFVIRAEGNRIVIIGSGPSGTEFGIYDFLERFVGVRWLFPGEHGTDIPAAQTITVPAGTISDEPVFMSRLFSGLRGGPQVQWARFNRMHGRISFHHNLNRVFPPETYTATNPEFFPMKDGETRFLPPTNDTHGWQPCFTEPGTVDEAITNIKAFFAENPGVPSFSLGVNDSSGHCRCPNCAEQVGDRQNFLGRSDYSDLYYAWANKVIEGVLEEYPDKWFGCLAYSEVAAPPQSVQVHPRLIPYMTYDRMKWIDPELQQDGHEATEGWNAASPVLGWYDYIYGSPYCLPRVYFHHSAEYLRYGMENGVKAHYAELYPNWGEGPKPYIFLRLWWNPQQDVQALLDEWYERFAGPEASEPLKRYYEIWERFWTEDIRESPWFGGRGQYLSFSNPRYLGIVNIEDIRESRRLLDEALEKCQTDAQRHRVGVLEKAFQYYEASALAYLAEHTPVRALTNEAEALAAIDFAEEALLMNDRRIRLATEEFADDPVLVIPLDLDRFPLVRGEHWGSSSMWALISWAARGENAVTARLREMAHSSPSQLARRQARMLLTVSERQGDTLNPNPSFEAGEGNAAEGWSYWLRPDPHTNRPVGRMLRSTDVAHSGEYSLLCDGMGRGGPVNAIELKEEGVYCAVGWVYVPEGQEVTGTCELALGTVDVNNTNAQTGSTRVVPVPGQWTLVAAMVEAKLEHNGREVKIIRVIPIVDGWQDGGKVYWDDVGIYRIE